MAKHNNIVPNVHLRKHWQRRTKTHFDQPAKKLQRHQNRIRKAKAMFPRPTQSLRPVVSSCSRRYAGKVRYGRGFTLAEIKQAKLSAAFARSVGIAVDHRRTNTSNEQLQANVERLAAYKDKLILFPRRQDKPKKGQINDSDAATLASAGASNQVCGTVLPMKKPEQAVQFAAISADDKQKRACDIIREARW